MPRRKNKVQVENTENNIEKENAEIEKPETVEIVEPIEVVEFVEKAKEIEIGKPGEVIEIESSEETDETDEMTIYGGGIKIAQEIDFGEEDDEPEEKPKKSGFGFKDTVLGTTFILGAITFFTVLILAVLNSFTAPIIAHQLADEEKESIASLFGDEIEYEAAPGYTVTAPVTEVVVVKNIWSGELEGYCAMVTPKGFGGKIIMLVAIYPDITVKDTRILEMDETVGQGAKIDSEKWFRDQFKYKSKDIRIAIAGENTVNVIAGATVSSRAFVHGVNAALSAADEINRKMSGEEEILTRETDETEETAENGEEGENPDE